MSQNSVFFLNFILYIVLLLVSIRKRANVIGILLITVYALVAVGGLYFSTQGAFGHISTLYLWPFFYFYVIFILMVIPLCEGKNSIVEKLNVKNYRALNKLCTLYIIISLFYIVVLSSSVIAAIQSGEWLMIYNEMRGDDAQLYGGPFEQVLINLVTYLRIPVLFCSFFIFAKNISYRLKWVALLTPGIDAIVWAIYTASRTEFVLIFSLYFACYLIFSKYLSSSIKNVVRIVFLGFASIATVVIIAVSASRFGEGESYWLSDYFGDSFRVAHNAIALTYEKSDGSRFFHEFYSWFGVPIKDFKCHIDDGSAFHTLIGMRYTDFGFIGTLIYAFICFFLFRGILKKKKLSIGDIYVVLYYYSTLFIGVFYDSSSAFKWLIVLTISVILNKVTKYVKTKDFSILSPTISSCSRK